MEHLDPDEEDEEGEASVSANIRNKAINALLGGSGPLLGPSPRNQAGPETDDDDSDGDERTPGVRCFQSCFSCLASHTHMHNYVVLGFFSLNFDISIVCPVVSKVKASGRLLGPRPNE